MERARRDFAAAAPSGGGEPRNCKAAAVSSSPRNCRAKPRGYVRAGARTSGSRANPGPMRGPEASASKIAQTIPPEEKTGRTTSTQR